MTASTLALLGFDTYCVCYSDYLSQRDYTAFEPLFNKLDLLKFINYGTFNKVCEDVLNKNGDVRQVIETFIRTNQLPLPSKSTGTGRARILLIDEVDVFFSKEFYGNRYQPSLSLTDPVLTNFISLIWKERHNSPTLLKLKESDEFKACLDQFGVHWAPLITESAKDMLYELNSFETHEYVVKNDKIGYKELDKTVFDTSYGYKTLFAYFLENQNGKISAESLSKNTSLLIRLGTFSYAEIPKQFDSILGCSGTLSTLSRPEQDIIENIYSIQHRTFIPSVYGRNNLIFNKETSILIEAEETCFQVLKKEIENRLVGVNVGTKRAVFVVFESKQTLRRFLESVEYMPLRNETLVLTEEASVQEKSYIINSATLSGKITFFTKIFGRGTDFKVHDTIVSVNGGVHVIQTFLSEELSEEIQIKGRTARQGENGSYSLVLPVKSLEKFLIQPQHVQENQNKLYQYLNEMRCKFFNLKYEENVKYVEQIKQKHLESIEFLEQVFSDQKLLVREFLLEQNKGFELFSQVDSKTLILMDATGSMTYLLDKLKNKLETMFERVFAVLNDANLNLDSFQIKLAVYRNYNSTETMLMQTSSWENRPENLVSFLKKIYATDGNNFN